MSGKILRAVLVTLLAAAVGAGLLYVMILVGRVALFPRAVVVIVRILCVIALTGDFFLARRFLAGD